MGFDPKTAVFKALFQFDKTISKPSILYKNSELFYPNGYIIHLSDSDGRYLSQSQYTVKKSDTLPNHLEVLIKDEKLDGHKLSIALAPGPSRRVTFME